MRKKIFTLLTLMLAVCSGAWADTQTIMCGTVSDAAFTYSNLPSYSYSNPGWAKDNDGYVISISSGGSFTFTNKDGVNITSIKVQGVAHNNGDKQSTVTISDGEHSVTTGKITWNTRTNSDPTEVVISSGINLSMEANTEYTVSNSGYNLGIQIVITYEPASDTTKPTFSLTTPATTSNVAITGRSVVLTASETVSKVGDNVAGTLKIGDAEVSVINYTFDSGAKTLTYTFSEDLAYEKTYAFTVDANQVQDAAGNKNDETSAFTFTTRTAPKSVTYRANGGTGDDIVDEDATVIADCSFTAPTGKTFTNWNTQADGEGTDYVVGAEVTASLTLYAQWEETSTYSVTYNANGGSGNVPTDKTEYTEGETVTVADNIGTLTKAGYSLVGWNTNSAATTASQTFGSTFEMGNADVTLYAIWQENFYEFTPNTSGDALNNGDIISGTGSGGTMRKLDGTINYNSNGLFFQSNSSSKVSVTLNDYLKAGSTIILNMYSASSDKNRGLKIATSSGGQTAILAKQYQGNFIMTYTVEAGDGLIDTKVFQLQRNDNIYLKSLTVTNCQPGGEITDCGWTTYSSSKPLDLSSLSATNEVTAYYASAASGSTVTLKEATGNIPANTGLMIKGTAGEKFTIGVAASGTAIEDNLLKAQTTTGNVDASNKNDNGKYHYVFGYKTSDATEYGFYNLAADTELAAGKAYLETTTALTPTEARISIVFDDEETGINDVKSVQKNNNRYYNLNGLEVAQPTKGLYIVNGKKVVIK